MISFSFIIPTYNSTRTLEKCLKYIDNQDYNKSQIEIILIDGISNDDSREIGKKFNAKVLDNYDKKHQIGRIIGSKEAKNDFLIFLDSDNYLTDRNTLKIFSKCIHDQNVNMLEIIEYGYESSSSHIDKYCALLGADDPLAYYLNVNEKNSIFGNNYFKKNNVKIIANNQNYTLYQIDLANGIASFGANGFVIKRKFFNENSKKDFYHVRDLYNFLSLDNRIAMIKTSVVHDHASNIIQFIKKKLRRYSRSSSEINNLNYYKINTQTKFIIIIKSILVIPILLDSIIGLVKSKEVSALYHFFLFYTALFLVFLTFFFKLIKSKKLNVFENTY